MSQDPKISQPEVLDALIDPCLTGNPTDRESAAQEVSRILSSAQPSLPPVTANVEEPDDVERLIGQVKDQGNPFSVYNALPTRLREYVLSIPDEYFEMSASEIEDAVKPNTSLIRLRYNFWHEMDQLAARVGHYAKNQFVINLGAVVAGCGDRLYFDRVLKFQGKEIAWIFMRPANYSQGLEVAHGQGLSRLLEILEAQPIRRKRDSEGNISVELDTKVAALQLKVFEMIDYRLKGAPVQKNFNVNANAPASAEAQASAQKSVGELEREVKLLEEKTALPSGSAVNGFEES